MKKMIFFFFLPMAMGLCAQGKYSEHDGKTRGDSIYSDWKGWMPKDTYKKYNYETYAMPGVGYAQYLFEGEDSTGRYSGIFIEYLLWAKSHQNMDFGPSHVKVYMRFSLSKSNNADMGRMYIYTAGIQMSIEKNPKRTFLIPFFGAELGGISQRELGSSAIVSPLMGVHVFARRNFYLNLYGSYFYPTRNYDYLSGYSIQASVNFAMW